MLCAIILSFSGWTYNLNSTPKNKFLRNFSQQFYLLHRVLPKICLETTANEIFSHISFCWKYVRWGLHYGFTSNYFYLLIYGELKKQSNLQNKVHNTNTSYNKQLHISHGIVCRKRQLATL